MRAALWHRLPPNFEEQLLACRERGILEYHFDDGYDDIVRAGRILERHELRGVFFIVPGWLGLRGQAKSRDVIDLHLAGHEIGNHTMHHSWLAKVPRVVARAEWADADRAIEGMTGVRPVRKAWPYGRTDPNSRVEARGIQPFEVFAPGEMTARQILEP